MYYKSNTCQHYKLIYRYSFLQPRGLHNAFNKCGIPLFVKSSKSVKISCMHKIILCTTRHDLVAEQRVRLPSNWPLKIPNYVI